MVFEYDGRMQSGCDVLIAGGGIVGLSVARDLLISNPKLKVVVAEKESHLGAHASGRNSGVLHAGFYYSPDSLKAKFCKDGNKELRILCKNHGIEIIDTGKIVVAKNASEVLQLEKLYQRGILNGIEVELLESKHLINFEPLARTHEKFLWSPTTAVGNPSLIIQSLSKEVIEMGGLLLLENQVKLSGDGVAQVGSELMTYRHFVNCAGAQSDRLAHEFGVGKEFTMIPFMGKYRAVERSLLPIRTLIYPVPHHINPFLGVHFTLTIDGKVKIGPTAIPILGREQYAAFRGLDPRDILDSTRALITIARGESHDLSSMIRNEFPRVLESVLVQESSALVPKASEVKGWKSRPPGIRSQLVNLTTGQLEQDFVVLSGDSSTHILNAVSPGWTAALPFGRWVVREKIMPWL